MMGPCGQVAKIIITAWDMIVQDTRRRPVSFKDDINDAPSPIILVVGQKMYSITNKISKPPYLEFNRLTYKEQRRIQTYITQPVPLYAHV